MVSSSSIRFMLDINQIRHRNVRLLVSRLEEEAGKEGDRAGGLVMLAAKLGKAAPQVSHFAAERPTKNIGDKIAREIEQSFGLEYGWMDCAHWGRPEAASDGQSHPMGLDADTLSETAKALLERDHGRDWFKFIVTRPDLFIQAYQLYAERTSDVITERQLGIKLADLVPIQPRDATGDEREKKVPASGTPRRSMGKGGKR
jgi:hypothetical protein